MSNGKKIKLSDIAEKAGVSISAVSAVYNGNRKISVSDEKRDHINRLLRKYQYVSQKTVSKHPLHLRVITKYPADMQMWSQVIAGIQKRIDFYQGTMSINESEVFHGNLYTDPKNFLSKMDGVIFISKCEKKACDILKNFNVPFCICGSGILDENIDMVYPQFFRYSDKALDYLTALGHKNIVYIPTAFLPHFATEQTILYYKEKCTKLNIKPEIYCINSEGNIYLRLKEILLRKNRRSAIVGYVSAQKKYIESLGFSIPNDLSLLAFDVSGFENHSVSYIGTDNDQLGAEAVELINYRKQFPNSATRHITLPLKLFDFKSSVRVF